MKNSSIAALAFSFSLALPLFAEAVTTASGSCEFLPDAPDQYEVVRGDTLWGISERFLKSPWCWPEVWGLNQAQISDPHWIYPGQVVYFDREHRRLSLKQDATTSEPLTGVPAAVQETTPTVRISPKVHSTALEKAAIPSIPSDAIEPFLSQPLVIEKDGFKDAPRIVAAEAGHVFLGKGDTAYVRGNLKDQTLFQVFRPGQALTDPTTKAGLGYEANYLGTLQLVRAANRDDEAHIFVVASSKEEMGVGDRLAEVKAAPLINYVPHPPKQQVRAQILSIHGGVKYAGQYQVVTINRGARDGIDIGTVLELNRSERKALDPTSDKVGVLQRSQRIVLPGQVYGSVFIFRVFDGVSHGLIVRSTDAAQLGDELLSPPTHVAAPKS